MGLQALLEEVPLDNAQRELRDSFLETTGYSEDDLLSLNYVTRIFLTRNGGKYRVQDDGSIEHLAGPGPDVEDRMFS